jgi:hypothetical protein
MDKVETRSAMIDSIIRRDQVIEISSAAAATWIHSGKLVQGRLSQVRNLSAKISVSNRQASPR